MPHEFRKKKCFVLKCHLLLFYATMNQFLIKLWCAIKRGFYMTISNDQLSVWTKKLQSTCQSQTCTQKKVTGHCLVVCCWNDPLQLSESQWNYYIWETGSANRWEAPKTVMPAASIDQQKEPNSSPRQCITTFHTTNASKVEQIGPQSFASSATFTWPVANWLPLLQAYQQFLTGKILP